MAKVIDIVNYLKEKYPLELASSFDEGKIGLQFGNQSKTVQKIMLALDGTYEVIKEAIDNNVDLLITHHPFMFSPLLHLDYQSPLGKKLLLVFKHELNIFAMHTNFDCANNGMNDLLASKLQLDNVSFDSHCPENERFLRIGDVEPIKLNELAVKVKTIFNEDYVRIVGNPDAMIKKVAILGGAGSSYIINAKKLGCDCIITGEIRHNHALDAIDYHMNVIEVSHSVEANFKEYVKKDLEEVFKDVEVLIASNDKNPFLWI